MSNLMWFYAMFRIRKLFRSGLFIFLILAVGMGMVAHGHAEDSGEPGHIIQEKMHSHAHDGNPGPRASEASDTGKQDNHHLPSTLDHLQDSWFFSVEINNSRVGFPAFLFHGDTDVPHQNVLGRMKKPPRVTLKS